MRQVAGFPSAGAQAAAQGESLVQRPSVAQGNHFFAPAVSTEKRDSQLEAAAPQRTGYRQAI